jgi:alginate O-acetyltransferase complex protein AlgI
MVATILVNYIAGLLVDKFRGTVWSKVALWGSVIVSLGSLGFFKYSDFFISNINSIANGNIPLLKLALPIGISFYTFQILSYTIDVYRGEAKVQKSLIRLATYVSLFPQLIAGPIVRYTTVEEELSNREHSFSNFSYGVTRFIIGLSKKVLIADTLGGLARTLMGLEEKSVVMYWIYAIAISFQLYFDFSGYSDMAIGLGRIFGFKFLENFNYPFISKSVAEFWRRWHMSLGTWFRDYVYIPLGGNRVSKYRWIFNTLAVWFLTGFWHGADWTFILWGLLFAALLMLEKFFLGNILKKIPAIFSHIYVVFILLISFVLFSANGLSGALSDIGGMFGAGGIPFWTENTGYYLSSYAFVLIFALVGSTPIVKNTVLKIKSYKVGKIIIDVLEPVFVVAMLFTVTAYFVDGSFSPFLYFRF